jgi:glycosyltransferase involved in cell wall biosynthesis
MDLSLAELRDASAPAGDTAAASRPARRGVCCQQTCVPDYRVEFFAEVARLIPGFRVVAGTAWFDPSLALPSLTEPWFRPCANRFLAGRKLLFQTGAFLDLLAAEVAVFEMNPRILSNWVLLALRRVLHRPSLVWGHFYGGRSQASLRFTRGRRLMVALADGVAAYTETDRDRFQNHSGRLLAGALGNSCLARRDCVPAHASGPEPRDLLYVGRLIPEKKVDVALRAFSAARDRGAQFGVFHVVGDGPCRTELEALARDLGADVVFHGRITDPARLAELHAPCLASVSPGYVGLSAVQSLARGIPVVLSRDEPNSPEVEVCREGETALFAASATEGPWTESLVRLFAERDSWISRRAAISARIAEAYTFESMARNFVDLVAKAAPTAHPNPEMAR